MSGPGTDGHGSTTDLAYERTRLALHRTLMAWTRTAVSMVGFGFSIPKFLHAVGPEHGRVPGAEVGLMLIGIGTGSLIAGAVDSVLQLRKLQPGRPFRDSVSLALIMSIAVILVSAYAFVDVLVHARR